MRTLAISFLFFIAVSIASAAVQTTTFNVENMTCATCPLTIKIALSRLDGVRKVDVDFDQKTVTVLFDDAKVTREAIAEASRNAGFPAKAVN